MTETTMEDVKKMKVQVREADDGDDDARRDDEDDVDGLVELHSVREFQIWIEDYRARDDRCARRDDV